MKDLSSNNNSVTHQEWLNLFQWWLLNQLMIETTKLLAECINDGIPHHEVDKTITRPFLKFAITTGTYTSLTELKKAYVSIGTYSSDPEEFETYFWEYLQRFEVWFEVNDLSYIMEGNNV